MGFIGTNLTGKLLDAGMRVTVLTPSRARHEDAAREMEARGVRVAEGDLRQPEHVLPVVEGQDFIFHAAGQSGAVRSMEDPWADLDVNCRGSLVLLEALRAANPTAKVVFLGSRLEYGHPVAPQVAEDHPLDPLCVYGVHKAAVEQYLALYAKLFGIRYTVARVTNPYGPGQPRARTAYGIVNRMIHLALNGEPVIVYGDGAQRRDYIYVDDVSDALVRLATTSQTDGRAYNVGTGTGTRLVDMAHAVTRLAGGGRVQMVPWPALAQQIETGDFVADISRISGELGWCPSVPLEQGLQQTVAFYRAHVTS